MKRSKDHKKLLQILDGFLAGREIITFNIERDVKMKTGQIGTVQIPGDSITIRIDLHSKKL